MSKAVHIFCLIMAAFMLLGIMLLVSGPSMAEEISAPETPSPLPLDIMIGGGSPIPSGWNEDFTEYQDDSIHITIEKGTVTPKTVKKEIETLIVRIKIADPSQMRTAMSYDTYTGRAREEAELMANRKNAIVAVNGDFFKYYYDRGYVVRQGEFYRDATSSRHKFDMLVIDNYGNFDIIPEADTKKINNYIANLEDGRTIINTFNLGPALILNSEVQNMKETLVARQDDFQWCYAQQRVCIVQTGHLEYAIVETYGRTDASAGMTLQEFAEFVDSVCPNAICAYNLDGGGSTNVIVNGKRIHKTPGHREITDILYFATLNK